MTIFTGQVSASADDAHGGVSVNSTASWKTGISPTWFGWIFQNVTIPQGATIQSATLSIYKHSSIFVPYTPYARIHASRHSLINDVENFVDNPTISGRPITVASVTINTISPSGDPLEIDVTDIVQEAVSGEFWDDGDAMGFYARNLASNRYWTVSFYDKGPAFGAEISVTYTGDVEFTGSTGSIALTGSLGEFDILPPPIDITGSTGSIEITGVPASIGAEAVFDGARGYWPLDETSGTTAFDRSGNGHDGAYVNTPALNSTGLVPSRGGGSVDFEASSAEYVTIPDHGDLDLGDTFSLEAVFDIESLPGGSARLIFNKGAGAYSLRVLQNTSVGSGLLQLIRSGVAVVCSSTILLTTGVIYHVIATKTGAAAKLWVNGVDVTGTITNSTMVNTANALEIAAGSAANTWDGRMQDAAVYATVLDADRVAAHYAWLSEPAFLIEVFVDIEGSTGSIELVGNPGAWTLEAIVDDLTYGGEGTYGGNGFYGGPELSHPESSGRIRVDIYDAQGNKLAVPPLTALTVSYSQSIDEIGDFTLHAPASDSTLDTLGPVHPTHSIGYRLRIFVEGEGEVFRGIVREVSLQDSADGDPLVVIKGPGVGDDLISANMLLGRSYVDQAPSTMLTDMISLVDGWEVGVVSSPTAPAVSSVSAEASPVLAAIRQMAERFHYHARINTLTQTVDVGALGDASGLRLTSLPYFDPLHEESYPNIIAIASLTVIEQGADVWNSILPHGGGEGAAALTLEFSTRDSPYEILNTEAPDGRTLFYIEDADSVATYGRRQRVVVDKHSVPIEVSEEALEAAANALYDGAVSFLQASKQPTHTYRITPAPFRHVIDGVEQFKLGDTVHVLFKGRADMMSGDGYLYLDIDQDLYVSGYTRTIGDDAITWDLDVQDVLGRRLDPAARMMEAIEAVWAVLVEPKLGGVDPGGGGNDTDTGVQLYRVTIDARKVFWITLAELTFTIAGAGTWNGTITINGVDRTTDLGGPFDEGVEHTIDVKPFIDRFELNEILFEDSTNFEITVDKNTRGVGGASNWLSLFEP